MIVPFLFVVRRSWVVPGEVKLVPALMSNRPLPAKVSAVVAVPLPALTVMELPLELWLRLEDSGAARVTCRPARMVSASAALTAPEIVKSVSALSVIEPVVPLLPVEIEPPAAAASDAHSRAVGNRRRRPSGTIEIELGSGKRVRVDNEVDADALRRVLGVLGER